MNTKSLIFILLFECCYHLVVTTESLQQSSDDNNNGKFGKSSSISSTSLSAPLSSTAFKPLFTSSSFSSPLLSTSSSSSSTPWKAIPSLSTSESSTSYMSYTHPDDVNTNDNLDYQQQQQQVDSSSSSSSSITEASPSLSYSSNKNHFAQQQNYNNNRRPILTETDNYETTSDGGNIDTGIDINGYQRLAKIVTISNPSQQQYQIRPSQQQQSSLTGLSSQQQSSYLDQYDQRAAPSQYDYDDGSSSSSMDNGGGGYHQQNYQSPDYHQQSSSYHEEYHQQQPSPQQYHSEPSEIYYEGHGHGHDGGYDHHGVNDYGHGYDMEQPMLIHSKKPPTIKDLYYKSGYGKRGRRGGGNSDYGAAITSTDYTTGHYIRPKGARYPKAQPKTSASKTVIFTVPQPLPDDHEKSKKFEIPSIELAGLNKLMSNAGGGNGIGGEALNDMMKNSPVKIPAMPGIDFNNIIGNLFGDKGPPAISVAAPETLGKLIAPLLGHGKLLSFNMPNFELGLGGGHGGGHDDDHKGSESRMKLVGFSMPDFMKNSQKFLRGGFEMPKIDFSGEHESGLTLPHFDMPKTESIGKSPKITAIKPLGPSIHFLRHLNLPLPKVPKMSLPELGPFKSFKMPTLDLTKNFDIKNIDFHLPSTSHSDRSGGGGGIGNIDFGGMISGMGGGIGDMISGIGGGGGGGGISDMISGIGIGGGKGGGGGGFNLHTMEDSPKPIYVRAPEAMLTMMMTQESENAAKEIEKPESKSTNNGDNDNDDDDNQLNSMEKQQPSSTASKSSKSPKSKSPKATISKVKKIITAFPLKKGSKSIGHIVVEDYPYGRKQFGPLDDGGESEIGCIELDQIMQSPASSSNDDNDQQEQQSEQQEQSTIEQNQSKSLLKTKTTKKLTKLFGLRKKRPFIMMMFNQEN